MYFFTYLADMGTIFEFIYYLTQSSDFIFPVMEKPQHYAQKLHRHCTFMIYIYGYR